MAQTGTASRTYGGLSAEERRAARRRVLVEAALDLFTEGGSRAVSKRAVCAKAKLNERYFYEHFANADAVLEAIIQQQTTDVLAVIAAASADAGDTLQEQTRTIARAALEFLAADPRRGALLLGSYSSDVAQRAKQQSVTAIAKVVAGLFNDTASPAGPSVELAAYALVSGSMELIAAWLRGDVDTSAEDCADIVAGLLLSTPLTTTTLPGRGV